jgi:hypothetical protein
MVIAAMLILADHKTIIRTCTLSNSIKIADAVLEPGSNTYRMSSTHGHVFSNPFRDSGSPLPNTISEYLFSHPFVSIVCVLK